ncbi:MAG: hypothetical protein FJ382_05780 [Verrucomicrobia bacterium]|nr:hypothetical protein [Verrucomicrobiota bacterium]
MSPRTAFWTLLATLTLLAATVLHGQAAPAAARPAGDRPKVEVSGPSERISRSTLSAVAAGITYQPPPPPKPPEPKSAEEEEADAPKNGIVRLPEYVVQGERPPVFRERDINTRKGLGEIAVKRFLGETGKALNAYHLPLFGMSKEQYALMLYQEEERLKNMKDAGDKVSLLRETDPVAADRLKREVDQTFIRRSEFSTAPSGRNK